MFGFKSKIAPMKNSSQKSFGERYQAMKDRRTNGLNNLKNTHPHMNRAQRRKYFSIHKKDEYGE